MLSTKLGKEVNSYKRGGWSVHDSLAKCWKKKDIPYVERLATTHWLVMSSSGPQFLFVSPSLFVRVQQT